MRRTLLEIANNIAVLTHFDELQQVIGNEDKNARLILLCIRQGMERDIWRAHSWSTLRRFYEFSEAKLKSQYNLPDDFGWYVNDTAWRLTNRKPMDGPLDPYQWQIRVNRDQYVSPLSTASSDDPITSMPDITSFTFAGTNDTWSLGDGSKTQAYLQQIIIYPIPDFQSVTSANTYSLAYISRNYIVDNDGNAKDRFGSDSDIPMIDADLIEMAGVYRVRRSLGISYSDHFDELQSAISDWRRKEGGMKRMRANSSRVSRFYPNIPETGYGR